MRLAASVAFFNGFFYNGLSSPAEPAIMALGMGHKTPSISYGA